MVKKNSSRLIGTGSYLPSKILNNSDLEKLVETSDEWIVTRTGMNERRIASEDECTSHMGIQAAKKALAAAKKRPEEIDLILVATMTPDYLCPSTAALIQSSLKAGQAAAFDLQAACTGFLYALSMAKAYIESGIYANVLVIASEKMSSFIDYTDRNTCILFGDGASACVVSNAGPGLSIDTVSLGTDGDLAELITIPAGGCRHPATLKTVEERLHFFKMNGKEVFKNAVRRMEMASKQCLKEAGLKEEEISWLVPHQANLRIIDAIAKQMNLPDEKVYKTVHKYGNTSASSVAIALDELLQEKEIQEQEHLLLVAFGGGLTWGAAVLTQIDG